MKTEIKQVETLSDDQNQRLYNWGEDIFGSASLNLYWRPKDVHFLLYEDRNLLSHVGILQHTIKVGEELLRVGGVGGVVTLPEAQGKGYARTLLRRARDFFEHEWKVDAGFLFCLDRLIPFYQSLGWQVVREPVIIEQPSGQISAPLNVMVLPLQERVWPGGEVELRSHPW